MTHHTVSKGRDERAERAVLGSWLGAVLGVAGVLVPKCPLCVAAYLCLFGVSASSAQAIAKLGVPLCIALVLASLLGTAFLVAQRGRRSRARTPSSSNGSASADADVHACCCRSR